MMRRWLNAAVLPKPLFRALTALRAPWAAVLVPRALSVRASSLPVPVMSSVIVLTIRNSTLTLSTLLILMINPLIRLFYVSSLF